MKDPRIGRLAMDWSHAFDAHEKARRDLAAAHRKANETERVLNDAKENLLKQVQDNASLTVMEQPIVVRAWEKHYVIIDVKAGTIRDAIAVDRD